MPISFIISESTLPGKESKEAKKHAVTFNLLAAELFFLILAHLYIKCE